MKILFLDDMEVRHSKFRNFCGQHNIFHVYTVEEAILALKKESPFNIVYLDHDLGGGIYLPSDDNSGYAVAKYISLMNKEKIPEKVVIHSWNEKGAAKMMDILVMSGINAVCEPFFDGIS